MIELVVFAFVPDELIPSSVYETVMNKGHRLQSFTTCDQVENALNQGATPALVVIEPTSDFENEGFSRVLRRIPQNRIWFLSKPGEEYGNPIAQTFNRAQFLTQPALPRDLEELLERADTTNRGP